RVLIVQGRWSESVQLLERVRPKLVSPPELVNQINIFLAQCYEQLDDSVQQRQAYERVIQRDPLSHVHVKGASVARLGLQRLRLLEAMRREQPDWEAVDNDLAKAEPGNTDSLLLRVESLAARDRIDEARKLLQERMQRDREQKQTVKVELYTALAALAERQG